MSHPDELKAILDRIATDTHTATDVAALRRLLSDGNYPVVQQLDGKYNIHIGQGQNIYIGDSLAATLRERIYPSGSDEAIQALIQAIRADQNSEKSGNYVRPESLCRDRQALDRYLQATLDQLRQRGCLEIQQNVIDRSHNFNYIAKIVDFEPGLGMRGEAFFMFSEFADINLAMLQRFSAQSAQWAKQQVSPSATGQAFFNFRVPTHFCFAIALVDQVEDATAIAVQTTNPFEHRVDLLWYEIPVIYELSQQRLHYYDKAANFWENFRGEIVWRSLRAVIQQVLLP
jgi:Effector-associated domain 10